MKKTRKSLSKSIILSCCMFIFVLCFAQAGIAYMGYNHILYHRYNIYMRDLLYFVHAEIDRDDLENCINTGKKSGKYEELQVLLDKIKDSYDIHFIYIVKPLNAEEKDNLQYVISGMSTEEKKNHPEYTVELNELTGTEYSSELAKKYQDCMKSREEVLFFRTDTDLSMDYSGVLPLLNSKNEPFALLAVDIEVSEIKQALHRFVQLSMGITVGIGAVFVSLWMLWLRKRVLKPIQDLEVSVNDFAEKSRNGAGLDTLVMQMPDLRIKDEMEALSRSILKMSEDVTGYAKSLLQAEGEVERMKNRVSRMGVLAYKDALTQVKNKTSYDEEKALLDQDIQDGTAQFAIVMIDLNHLKKMNDTYGHEHGNDYIQLSCRMISVVFAGSSVFRIGGDEFVVVLKNQEYEKREKLVEILREDFEMTSSAEELEPWERASAAIGMAVYEKGKDSSVEDVFKRADVLMYENKKAMKAGRE